MSVYIQTELAGKINNLPSFKSEALLPVFEAVVNSIQAIEDRGLQNERKITVSIHRSPQKTLTDEMDREKSIVGFDIEDNGIGFNDINYDAFKTADTTHKFARGCKGIGRFYWLKAFNKVEIDSVYTEGKKRYLRKILFTSEKGFEELSREETDFPQKTIVKLIGYKREYREQPSSFKTTQKIAQRILEHCLSYYINDCAPHIMVKDDEELIRLDSLFDEIRKHLSTETFSVGENEFTISHIKLYSTHTQVHGIVFCAHSRDVRKDNIANFLGTSQQFDEADCKFVYTAYVSGGYLDKYVRGDRISFDIPEDGALFASSELTLEQIRQAAQDKARLYLADYLEALQERKLDIAKKYVAENNPTLRAVVHYYPEALKEIEPNSADEKIDEVLYKYKGRAELAIRQRGAKLLKTQAESVAEISEEYKKLTTELEDFQRDQLAGYVIFRKMIIDLLDKKLQLGKDGKFEYESIIHDILFPRKTTTEELDYGEHNLWLIDERLAFHTFAASDKPLCDSTSSDSENRPDILAFAEVDEDRIARTVSIIELKQPMRKSLDEDPTKQMLRYVRDIRKSGTIKLPTGRELRISNETRCYCYAVCDLATPIKEYAESHGYSRIKGELGYYWYNPNEDYNCHIEVIGFDKLVSDAKRRHQAFFAKLGIDLRTG
ncbi:MAG: hypothetical protein K8R46_11385 [Pirellulales bacterium]|nr:hypothetical protein [Pirellulales bacterium]